MGYSEVDSEVDCGHKDQLDTINADINIWIKGQCGGQRSGSTVGVKGQGQSLRSKVNVKCLPGNRSLTNQPSADSWDWIKLFFYFKGQCRGQNSGSKVRVRGQGERSRSKVNFKVKCLPGNKGLSHQPSADFPWTERKKEKEKEEKEEIEYGATIQRSNLG